MVQGSCFDHFGTTCQGLGTWSGHVWIIFDILIPPFKLIGNIFRPF